MSNDFQIEAAGGVGFGGDLNFRLSVYLAPSLGQKVSPQLGENMQLGPIPILITGSITQPSIRKDPMLIGAFLESLMQQQFSKIASRFIPTSSRPVPEELANHENQAGEETVGSKTGQPQTTEQALLESGFNLLEGFLSKKKTSSS